jgi:RHS repeat-associated protein
VASSLPTGIRLATVDSNGAVVRSAPASAQPVANDPYAVQISVSPDDWTALTDPSATSAGGLTAAALSIAATSTLRASGWSPDLPFLPAPDWARASQPIFATAALPLEVRESLASLSAALAATPAGQSTSLTLYKVDNLALLARPSTAGDTPIPTLLTARFQAQPFADPFTGKNYVRERWYDPERGSWLSPDPLGNRDSADLYAFCAGDPVNCRDPRGTQVVRPTVRGTPSQTGDTTDAFFENKAQLFEYMLQQGIDPEEAKQAVALSNLPDGPMAPNAFKVFTRAAAIASPLTNRLEGGLGVMGSVAQGYAAVETGNPSMGVLAANNLVASGKMIITGRSEPSLLGYALQRAYATKFTPEEASNRAAGAEIGLNIVLGFAPGSEGREAIGEALDDAGITTPSSRWARGESIVRKTVSGNDPAWATVRSRYWKSEGYAGPPRRTNAVTGAVESMELNHRIIPQRWGFVPNPVRNAPWNLEELWPEEHGAVDWYRWQTLDPRLKALVPEPPKPRF